MKIMQNCSNGAQSHSLLVQLIQADLQTVANVIEGNYSIDKVISQL